jgi:hypothetical protein
MGRWESDRNAEILLIGVNHSMDKSFSEERRVEKLRLASKDLLYEIDMFDSMARALLLRLAGKSRISNAFVESFAIHARNLIYFLYADSPKKDEVTASNYFMGRVKWEEVRPAISDTLESAWGRADREIAHLTFERQKVTLAKKGWPVAEIHRDIFSVLGLFLLSAPDSLLLPALLKYRRILAASQSHRDS